MAMSVLPPLLPDRTRRDWTVDELRALPDDGNRYEVVDGELLVTPAPTFRHQPAVLRLAQLVAPYCDRLGIECVVAPADVTFSPRTVVEPDLFVIPLIDGKPASRFEDVGRLVLAVEILSPASARADRYVKRRLYQSEGVPEYWIVDTSDRFVERWRPEDESPEIVTESLAWLPREDAEQLVIDLPAYFRRVHGE